MAFLTFGSYAFPEKFIKWETLSEKPNQRQDLDSYTDAFGVTQRNALAHTKTQIVFNTAPMKASEYNAIISGIRNNYRNVNERDAQCTYYDTENCTFKTGHFYFDPSFEAKIRETDRNGIPTLYGEMTWTFIEY